MEDIKMSQWRAFLAGFVFLLLLACSASMVMQSGWYRGIVKIDGQLEDWNGLWQFPEGGKVALASKNDLENLFLGIKTRDGLIIRRIATQGFQVMIDRKGGHRSRYGLIYTGKLQAPLNKETLKGAKEEELFLASLNTALSGPIRLTSVDQNDDIQPFDFRGSAVSRYADGEWFCEFKIPLTGLKKLPEPGSSIGVGFKTALSRTDPMAFPDPRAVKQELITNEWWVKMILAMPPD